MLTGKNESFNLEEIWLSYQLIDVVAQRNEPSAYRPHRNPNSNSRESSDKELLVPWTPAPPRRHKDYSGDHLSWTMCGAVSWTWPL
jgi:hypothetical protein